MELHLQLPEGYLLSKNEIQHEAHLVCGVCINWESPNASINDIRSLAREDTVLMTWILKSWRTNNLRFSNGQLDASLQEFKQGICWCIRWMVYQPDGQTPLGIHINPTHSVLVIFGLGSTMKEKDSQVSNTRHMPHPNSKDWWRIVTGGASWFTVTVWPSLIPHPGLSHLNQEIL